MDHEVMDTEEAAAFLRVTPGYLKVSRCRNRPRGMRPGPPYCKRGRHVRYLKDDLLAWLKEGRQESAA